MATGRRPCYEDLAVENGELRALVERLTARLDALESENAELRRRLGQNSRNSSKRSSSDSPLSSQRRGRCGAGAGVSRAGRLGIRDRRWRRLAIRTSGCGMSLAHVLGAAPI
ncbi:MAG: DUF6444 domain-containing protein [Actinomycetota bacterium]|nr:DUF6444 domain-containing protein [Actinomycetota bacterium]MDQ3900938.1 DUF6444 domain-containing protein [Actinomycetota bacterium]